jgi:desumoylating isopeptidase 1
MDTIPDELQQKAKEYRLKNIWLTSITVFNKQYYYIKGMGRSPINLCPFGAPTQSEALGLTSMTESEFLEELSMLVPRFGDTNYDILTNNCNHFSNTCSGILLDKAIPNDIANQAWLM